MLVNLGIFLRVALRYEYKAVPRRRVAPPPRARPWYQAQPDQGVSIPVRSGVANTAVHHNSLWMPLWAHEGRACHTWVVQICVK